MLSAADLNSNFTRPRNVQALHLATVATTTTDTWGTIIQSSKEQSVSLIASLFNY